MNITLHSTMDTMSPSHLYQAPLLLLPTMKETLCIPLDSIIRIEASSNYSKVFCKNQSFPIVVSKVLRWFEERLPDEMFTRIHRTHVINKKYMMGVQNNSVVLTSGLQIGISRRKRKNLLSDLQKASLDFC